MELQEFAALPIEQQIAIATKLHVNISSRGGENTEGLRLTFLQVINDISNNPFALFSLLEDGDNELVPVAPLAFLHANGDELMAFNLEATQGGDDPIYTPMVRKDEDQTVYELLTNDDWLPMYDEEKVIKVIDSLTAPKPEKKTIGSKTILFKNDKFFISRSNPTDYGIVKAGATMSLEEFLDLILFLNEEAMNEFLKLIYS